ncbi:YtzI protein [Halobacillus amylolyticus]|uniref:YtzI protein n=1 Tax=Halobacillus amylolyticus TaxID=2932259 RepID=A0ABY4HA41_9BACI|nr:YtzI protein [Halobacillus amylolyticus]UOR11740.1 YtzI protein [Halobacillus amylolyticus]
MTFTIVMTICIVIVLGVAGASAAAISKGYNYKHTVDPLPDEKQRNEEQKKSDAR